MLDRLCELLAAVPFGRDRELHRGEGRESARLADYSRSLVLPKMRGGGRALLSLRDTDSCFVRQLHNSGRRRSPIANARDCARSRLLGIFCFLGVHGRGLRGGGDPMLGYSNNHHPSLRRRRSRRINGAPQKRTSAKIFFRRCPSRRLWLIGSLAWARRFNLRRR